ncbi:MAG: hypothetical protein MRY76_12610 [Pseudomonadales bacterium]|nr:hypothetical protein [Pseudomonadales bacterium]
MPMTMIQQFLYFLMLAALYGSPLILILLYLSWRNKAMTKGLIVILAGLLLGAGLLQSSFHFSMMRESASYSGEQEALAAYAGDNARLSVYTGSYVGTETGGSAGDLEFSVYQFAALDGSDRWLQLLLPPPGIGAVAYLRHASDPWPEMEAARLVVWTSAISLNPAVMPEEFFRQNVPGGDAHAWGRHTVMVNFRPRRSTVVYPGEAGATEWIWRDGVNEL